MISRVNPHIPIGSSFEDFASRNFQWESLTTMSKILSAQPTEQLQTPPRNTTSARRTVVKFLMPRATPAMQITQKSILRPIGADGLVQFWFGVCVVLCCVPNPPLKNFQALWRGRWITNCSWGRLRNEPDCNSEARLPETNCRGCV